MIKHAAMQGLGFPQLSNLKTVPVFFNMIDNGDLDEPIFGLYLNPFPTAEPAGEIMFGGVNRSLFQGELFTVPVLVKTCAAPPHPPGPGLLRHLAPARARPDNARWSGQTWTWVR